MLLRPLNKLLTATRTISTRSSRSLFASRQIRSLSTDPQEPTAIDPINYTKETIQVVYEDKTGIQKGELELDKENVKIFHVNQVNMVGKTFTSLLVGGVMAQVFAREFTLREDHTIDQFTLDFTMQLPVSTNTPTGTAHTTAQLRVQVAVDQAQSPPQVFQLTLHHGEHVIAAEPNAKFGQALLDIQLQLPITTYIRSCFMCTHSEYFPLGDGEFGTMGCFRDWPRVSRAKTPPELMMEWQRVTDQVQETYRCKWFQRRTRPHVKPVAGESLKFTSDTSQRGQGPLRAEKEWNK